MTTTPTLIGFYRDAGTRRRVEIEIRIDDEGELHVTGNSGRAKADGTFQLSRNGDPVDCSGGQNVDELTCVDEFAYGWDAARRDRLVQIWRAWHLNHMRAGCEHQRAAGWDKLPIDPTKPLNSYGLHFPGQQSASWNRLAWVRPDEHAAGLLGRECEVCGYAYGTAWLREDLPDDVIAFVEAITRKENDR